MLTENLIDTMTLGARIGLWVLLGAGLVVRYLLRLRHTSSVILAGIPLLGLVLVIATAVELHRGAEMGVEQALPAFDFGSSLAFGPASVRWADARFAHRFAGGPTPRRVPKHGPERQAQLRREWHRVVITAAIASVVLIGFIPHAATPHDQGVLWWWIGCAWAVAGLWYLFRPVLGNRTLAKPDEGKPAASAAQSGPQQFGGFPDHAELPGHL